VKAALRCRLAKGISGRTGYERSRGLALTWLSRASLAGDRILTCGNWSAEIVAASERDGFRPRGAAIDAASPSAAYYSCLVGQPVNNGGRRHRRNRPRPRCSALAIHIHCLAAMAEGRGVTGAIAWKRHARVYFNPSKLM
jgi:hypothetical protein